MNASMSAFLGLTIAGMIACCGDDPLSEVKFGPEVMAHIESSAKHDMELATVVT